MNKEILEKLKDFDIVVGVDEVGRGPIAGPVSVSAFGITKKYYKEVLEKISGITDSKKLTEKKREAFVEVIRTLKNENKIFVSVSSVTAAVIDEKGISAALRAALKRAVDVVCVDSKKSYIYLDGSLFAPVEYQQETIIKGDSKNWLIGAASVVAKVTRDHAMIKYGLKFPEYGFERHKGYGTKAHYEAIKQYGVIDLHRKTWVK